MQFIVILFICCINSAVSRPFDQTFTNFGVNTTLSDGLQTQTNFQLNQTRQNSNIPIIDIKDHYRQDYRVISISVNLIFTKHGVNTTDLPNGKEMQINFRLNTGKNSNVSRISINDHYRPDYQNIEYKHVSGGVDYEVHYEVRNGNKTIPDTVGQSKWIPVTPKPIITATALLSSTPKALYRRKASQQHLATNAAPTTVVTTARTTINSTTKTTTTPTAPSIEEYTAPRTNSTTIKSSNTPHNTTNSNSKYKPFVNMLSIDKVDRNQILDWIRQNQQSIENLSKL